MSRGNSPLSILFTVVYGCPRASGWRQLWEELGYIGAGIDEPWLVAGDFNAVLSASEVRGSALNTRRGCDKFHGILNQTGLRDMEFSGPKFTWPRGGLRERLDRALSNDLFEMDYPDCKVFHLPRIRSDHRPILITTTVQVPTASSPSFHFNRAWLSHSAFGNLVAQAWVQRDSVFSNLTGLQGSILEWNHAEFGSISRRKKKLIAQIGGLQSILERCQPRNLVRLEQQLRDELEEILDEEEVQWKLKSRSDWLALGDRNTAYFHRRDLIQKKMNYNAALKIDGGDWCFDEGLLQESAVHFYASLYTADGATDTSVLPRHRFPPIRHSDYEGLRATLSMEEVSSALKEMAPDKAPGPDGYQTSFFLSQWPIVGHDVFQLLSGIFSDKKLPYFVAATMITLIPKTENPETFSDLRPISLCSVLYRLTTKIIANRMKQLMGYVVSPNQVSFIAGRGIIENIIIAQECIHTMERSYSKTGWMAIKVDLEKSFDRLNWGFILVTLQALNLPSTLIELIMECVSSSILRIKWNEELMEEFRPTRGIR